MRIEAYNQITQVYNAGKAAKVKSGEGAKERDQVQISQAGRDYQVAKQAVAESADIRENRVAKLKTDIASGNYKIEAGDFASRLIEKYNAYL